MPGETVFADMQPAGCELALTPACERRINDYIKMLVEYNRQLNLTAITGEGEIWRKHVMDALLIFCALEIAPGTEIIDVGSGAGIPGLILKLYRPDLRLTLLEARQKKIEFLRRVITELGLEATRCLWARAEEAGQDKNYREKYGLAVARGVAPLNTLAEYCLPLVAPGGAMVAYKGPAAPRELQEAAGAIAILGGGEGRLWQQRLPDGEEQRTLVIIAKERPTPARYPRRPGVPARKPLK